VREIPGLLPRFPVSPPIRAPISTGVKQLAKLVALISGGIDSPVAAYLMIRRGVEIVAVHMDNRPFTDDKNLDKALHLVRHLRDLTGSPIRTYVVPHGPNHIVFARNCNRHLHCLFCRRMMYRVAERIAEREGAVGILTGESMGQVASQTVQNINVVNQVARLPIIRPLIGLDKVEIIEIAHKIGTYEISTLPGLCCTIVPKQPSTAAKLPVVLAEEGKIDIDALVEKSLEGMYVLAPEAL
jgi:tRNA uracil 4-sulfurtransferase